MTEKKPSKKRKSFFIQMGIILTLAVCILLSSVFVLLFIGMFPTLVSLFTDKTKRKMRTITVAAMNFTGCVPFLIQVVQKGFMLDVTLNILLEPRTIVVMYMAAAMGYMIDWAMTGIISSIMLQKNKARIKEIEKRQADFVKRWGAEVTGTIPLDKKGMAIESNAQNKKNSDLAQIHG